MKPRLTSELLGVPVLGVAAGYDRTLVLSSEGKALSVTQTVSQLSGLDGQLTEVSFPAANSGYMGLPAGARLPVGTELPAIERLARAWLWSGVVWEKPHGRRHAFGSGEWLCIPRTEVGFANECERAAADGEGGQRGNEER